MTRKLATEVVITGAGPVGLVAALALKRAGVDVQIFDTNRRTGVHSYAVVLHADTLGLLDKLGLIGGVTTHGVAVTKVGLYEGAARMGELDVSALGGKYPHLVVLPQSRLELLLEDALAVLGTKVHWQHRVQDLDPRSDGVRLTVAQLDSVSTGYPIARSEQVVAGTFEVAASWLIGADGYDSFVRRRLGVDFTDLGGREIVSVYQCETDGTPPQEGRMMFGGPGVGAYWPLRDGRCRISFPIATEAEHRGDAAGLSSLLAARAPWFQSEVKSIEWTASATFDRRLATRFGADRVWLAGDAAHLTAPAGAQSMNVGLREADDLGNRIASVLRRAAPEPGLADYDAARGAEWRRLLLQGSALRGGSEAWAARQAGGVVASVPASGTGLDALLRQLGVELVSV